MKELIEIRDELLIGVENKDLLYIKMQINKIDTLIHNANQEKTMNIHSKKGTKVSVTEDSIKNGYGSVKEHAKKFLVVGETYTVVSTIVDGWSTAVQLKEFPDEVFNSVSFEDV